MADQNETAAAEAPGITLGDMATMVQIVDLCSKRGAFEGPELEVVGGLRSRVVAFVEANQPKEGDAPEGEVPVADAEPVEEDSDES
tara:strand:- start:165 stop:422 length:258 start_codon:yes stop_codon:yes gene_type:complete